MELWISGQYIKEIKGVGVIWELQGVFDEKEKAVKSCRDRTYFIAPVKLNQEFPHETVQFPEAYYPLAE